MSNDAEEITNAIYSKAAQLLFSGNSEDEVVHQFIEKDVPENIAVAITGKAKEDLIERAKELSSTVFQSKEANKLAKLCNDIRDQDGKTVTFVDTRELERFSDKDSVLSCVTPRCVVFSDVKRIDVTKDYSDKEGAHKRSKAWERIYDIEGTDINLKLGILSTISNNEYDGCDYIVINLKTDDGTYVSKHIYPNGETMIARVNSQFETSYMKGHINDEDSMSNTSSGLKESRLMKWLTGFGNR